MFKYSEGKVGDVIVVMFYGGFDSDVDIMNLVFLDIIGGLFKYLFIKVILDY